jgi:hypothetical protein
MKPLKEKLLIKDATIPKIQFDKEWFYKLDDMLLPERRLSEVEFVFLPMIIEGEQELCAAFDDIRGRKEIE